MNQSTEIDELLLDKHHNALSQEKLDRLLDLLIEVKESVKTELSIVDTELEEWQNKCIELEEQIEDLNDEIRDKQAAIDRIIDHVDYSETISFEDKTAIIELAS